MLTPLRARERPNPPLQQSQAASNHSTARNFLGNQILTPRSPSLASFSPVTQRATGLLAAKSNRDLFHSSRATARTPSQPSLLAPIPSDTLAGRVVGCRARAVDNC